MMVFKKQKKAVKNSAELNTSIAIAIWQKKAVKNSA